MRATGPQQPWRVYGPVLALCALSYGVPALAQPGFDCTAPLPPAPASWTTLGDGTPGSVDTATLQAALDAGGAIRLAIGTGTLALSQTLRVRRDTVLDVNGATLSGSGQRRVLLLDNPDNQHYTFTLLNARISGGHTPSGSGAGLYKPTGGPWQAVVVRVFDSVFENNHAIQSAQDDGGGALYVVGAAELALVRTRIVNNSGANGGGVYSLGSARVDLFDTVLTGNRATGSGGNPGNGGNGGGLGVDGAQRQVNLCRSQLIGNDANAYGGGLFTVAYDQQSFVRLHATLVQGNRTLGSANSHTAGVYLQGGPFEIAASSFIGNVSQGGYGGLSLFDHGGTSASGVVVNSTFHGNVAVNGLGGAINLAATGGVTIQNSTLANNRADCSVCFAGGISNAAGAPLTLRNVLFQNNTGGNAWNPWTLLNAPVAGSHTVQWPATRPGSGQAEAGATAGATFADVALGEPAYLGGPTPTLALPPGSAAVDTGTVSGAPVVDQRGRPRHGPPDIGAYELQADLIFRNGFQ
jgi:hypothetical protein